MPVDVLGMENSVITDSQITYSSGIIISESEKQIPLMSFISNVFISIRQVLIKYVVAYMLS